jgi:hypothetical protein
MQRLGFVGAHDWHHVDLPHVGLPGNGEPGPDATDRSILREESMPDTGRL